MHSTFFFRFQPALIFFFFSFFFATGVDLPPAGISCGQCRTQVLYRGQAVKMREKKKKEKETVVEESMLHLKEHTPSMAVDLYPGNANPVVLDLLHVKSS